MKNVIMQFADNAGRDHPVFAQTNLGLRCPATESMDTVVYADAHRMNRSYTYAHADLDFRCSHMT